MDEDLYDEFGNYIGPELDDVTYDGAEETNWYNTYDQADTNAEVEEDTQEMSDALVQYDETRTYDVVLPTEQKLYPTAEEVYPGVEILIQDEDTQPITVPIIKQKHGKPMYYYEEEVPTTMYNDKFIAGMVDYPEFQRTIAVVGALHHGKSSFIDMFVQHTHEKTQWNKAVHNVPYLDSHVDEQSREMTLTSKPITVVTPDLRGKSYSTTLFDTPGHLDFISEVHLAVRACDNVVIVLDVIEGITLALEKQIEMLIQERVHIVLCLNKLDRLIVEGKLPPRDAYRKIILLLEQFNALLLSKYTGTDVPPFVCPSNNTVIFASTLHKWAFTLDTFAQKYNPNNHPKFDTQGFAKRLWGKMYYDPAKKCITTTQPDKTVVPTFVHFVLQPLYKLYSNILGTDLQALSQVCASFHIPITQDELYLNTNVLLGLLLQRYFDSSIETITSVFTTTTCNALTGVQQKYRNYISKLPNVEYNQTIHQALQAPSKQGPMVLQSIKSIPHETNPDAFYVLARVMQGTCKPNTQVQIFSEKYIYDNEDYQQTEITHIYLYQGGRYKIGLSRAYVGSIVLLELSTEIPLTGISTITTLDSNICTLYRSIQYRNSPHFRVSIQPFQPTQLNILVQHLQKIRQLFTNITIHTEETGDIVLTSTGELQLDCILHHLRVHFQPNLEIRVSDPFVHIVETIEQDSELLCHASTANVPKDNKYVSKITTFAQPLEHDIIQDILDEKLPISNSMDITSALQSEFRTKYDWDILSSRNIWSFSADLVCPNMLLNDTVYRTNEERALLAESKQGIVDGFLWAMKEGPLIQEPMYGTKIKISNMSFATQPLYRTRKYIIPITRKSVYSSILTASPRLMEPIQEFEILTKEPCIELIHKVLHSRRGHVIRTVNVPGTPFLQLYGKIPLLDSCGLETDLRVNTQGQTHIQTHFSQWDIVPGDPLDKDIEIKPLVASPTHMLARDLLLKLRRRKGLTEDVDVSKYFDEDMLLELAQHMAQD